MNNKKIIIAGGSGFIGCELIKYFGKENTIVVLTRNVHSVNNRNNYQSLSEKDLQNTRFQKWDGQTAGEWMTVLNGAEILINLTGKSVNCRYTEQNKKEILESRVKAVNVLGEGIKRCSQPPSLWINASSATIYRHALDKAQDEYSTEFKDGFSVNVCREWEKTFFETDTTQTRKIALRMAITLGAGGVLIPYFNLLKFGLGGKQGSGKQMFSWIHIEDTCRIIEWVAENKGMQGIYNCSSPNPVTNAELMDTLRSLTGNRIGLPAPEWILKLGSIIIGTETELVLKSRWVLPTKLLESGFKFKYETIRKALEHIVAQVPTKQYRLL